MQNNSYNQIVCSKHSLWSHPVTSHEIKFTHSDPQHLETNAGNRPTCTATPSPPLYTRSKQAITKFTAHPHQVKLMHERVEFKSFNGKGQSHNSNWIQY